jgi:hypothetical protein
VLGLQSSGALGFYLRRDVARSVRWRGDVKMWLAVWNYEDIMR